VATGTGTFTAYRMKLISVICCTILTQGQWYTGKVTCCLFQGLWSFLNCETWTGS